MNRVVVTGMGAITPIGNSVNDFWQGIREERVGIRPIHQFDTDAYKVKLCADVVDFDPKAYMDPKSAKRMDRFSQFAVAAAKEAIEDAKLELDREDPYRIGISVGSGVGSLEGIEREHIKMLEKGPSRISPITAPLVLGNMAAANISIQFGIRGKTIDVVTACATGTNAIGEAFYAIRYGTMDVMVAGGVDSSISPLGIAAFQGLTALTEATDPMRASIPFDKERHGFVTGEGAGILILESLEHAKQRGARIYGEIAGYGATSDASHVTTPLADGSAAAKAMEFALKEAQMQPEDIQYINAHGTGTVLNDLYETRAIKKAFGDHAYHVKINSTKSMIGHLFGAGGPVELITCIETINHSYIHPTVGLKTDDPECDLDYTKGKAVTADVTAALSNSMGFGGHNASIVVKKFE